MVKTHKKIAGVVASLALVSMTAVSLTAQAGTEVATGKESKGVQPPVTTPVASNITGDIGVTFVSTYYSRGILQGPQGKAGFDAEPYLDLYFKLYENDDKGAALNKIQFQLSFWSNIATNTHPAFGGATNAGVRNWTEFDWMPGMSFVIEKNFTLTVSYFEFDYPSQGSSPQRSINTTLAYNDSDWLGMWALNPHVTFLQEITGNNNTGGGHVGLGGGVPGSYIGTTKLGQYYELGIAPSFTFMKSSQYPLTLTIPITTGLGSNGFYGGPAFGYASAGANISVPLAFIPPSFGSWTVTAGGTYYYLGKFTARQNGQFSNTGRDDLSGNAHNQVDGDEVDHNAGVASIGLGLTF